MSGLFGGIATDSMIFMLVIIVLIETITAAHEDGGFISPMSCPLYAEYVVRDV